MDITVLEDMGLTVAEAKVYVSLLKLGSSNATPLLEETNLQSSVVFRVLHSLITKGLVNYNLEGRRKNYQATTPEHFFEYLDEKKKRFEDILPELRRQQKQAPRKEQVTVYKGIRGIKEVYAIMRNTKGKEYNSFGGGKPCEDLLGPEWWKNHHRQRIARKLPARQVFDETVRKAGEWNNTQRISKVRFLPRQYQQLQETVIVGDKVSIGVFTESPYAFIIEDKIVAEGYRKHFEIMWKAAK